jgi:putative methyltransferase (TIGR04325 family)
VVEQPHFVAAGREFADDELSFFPTLSAALATGTVSTLLCSGVLQYVEKPDAILREAAQARVQHVVLDRVSFAVDGRERLVVQRPPVELGGAYPCRLFSRERLLAPLGASYRVCTEWPALDDYPGATFGGLHLSRVA